MKMSKADQTMEQLPGGRWRLEAPGCNIMIHKAEGLTPRVLVTVGWEKMVKKTLR